MRVQSLVPPTVSTTTGVLDVSLQVRGTVCIPSACPFLSSSLVSVPRGLGWLCMHGVLTTQQQAKREP